MHPSTLGPIRNASQALGGPHLVIELRVAMLHRFFRRARASVRFESRIQHGHSAPFVLARRGQSHLRRNVALHLVLRRARGSCAARCAPVSRGARASS
eukprot:7465669-Pyramimonas_sp.AAC.1